MQKIHLFCVPGVRPGFGGAILPRLQNCGSGAPSVRVCRSGLRHGIGLGVLECSVAGKHPGEVFTRVYASARVDKTL